MKRKLFLLPAFLLLSVFTLNLSSCTNAASDNNAALLTLNSQSSNQSGNSENPSNSSSSGTSQVETFTRSQALDFIFNPDSLAEISLNITRTEWNHLLKYYDWKKNNESCVHADFTFSKTVNGVSRSYQKSDIGFRIRGNTSRIRPQVGWGAGNNDYRQAHFTLDFEEFLTDDQEWKMAGCMKGMILKRFKDDPTYAREVYSYNLFRKNGIWTAPRAGYAHLTINIKDSETSTESINFGVFAMIEQINKQYLKERTSKNGGGSYNSAGGNLWKCTWKNLSPTLTETSEWGFGVEDVHFEDVVFDDANIGTENDTSSYSNYVCNNYSYDLKTNKSAISSAKTSFISWINELNALNDNDTSEIKNWYNNHMDPELFAKTYAINVILGMWDDYWANGNNYYFYFDSNGKSYFIPYDYDNVLGVNNSGTDWANKDPMNWGSSDRPLIEKFLLVDEFKALYKQYLLEFSQNDYFDANKAAAQITAWHSTFSDKVDSSQLDWSTSNSYNQIVDKTEAKWGSPYIEYKIFTPGSPLNYFTIRKACINQCCSN